MSCTITLKELPIQRLTEGHKELVNVLILFQVVELTLESGTPIVRFLTSRQDNWARSPDVAPV